MLLFLIGIFPCAFAQQYLHSGLIEYEVKTNNIKSMPDGEWKDLIKDKIPEFSVNYYNYIFSNDQSICKFSRTTDTKSNFSMFGKMEDYVWYNNYQANEFTNSVSVDNIYLISGPLQDIEWKIYPTDMRTIAGFSCRKASAILFDSVYVFAYYTDEILTPGGPMGLHGLPGMILGVTIPRLYQSWVATRVELNIPPKEKIAPPTSVKKKTREALTTSLLELSKSWGKDGSKFLNPLIWRMFM